MNFNILYRYMSKSTPGVTTYKRVCEILTQGSDAELLHVYNNRPDLCDRMFPSTLRSLKKELQKRGLK